jgi:cystathionine gamma-lyase
VISIDDVYGGTNRYFRRISTIASGVTFSLVDFTKDGELEAAFTPQTKMIWLETPTNPTLKIVDIAKTAKIAHEHNCLLVVDNTFMSPYFQRPLSLGADIVVHSVSKYINGHTDVIGGIVVVNDDDLHKRIRFLQNGMGALPSPFDCFLAMRGLKTLAIRMREHEKNAFAVARYLEKHPKVEKVIFPGLPSHPGHEIAKKQQAGFGGMITIVLKGGIDQSRQFLENLKVFTVAESLGGVDSLAEHPAIMTHASVPPEERAKLGILDGLCRLSVGLEDEDDILKDLSDALDAVKL